MKFSGLLLRESLDDEGVLALVEVTGTETRDVENPADFQPERWTAVRFEGEASQAQVVADRLSRALKPCWYADLATENEVYVVFADRVFRYAKGDRRKRAEAVRYGEWLGIPKCQLDWGE